LKLSRRENDFFPAGSGNPNSWLSSPQPSASLLMIGDFKWTSQDGCKCRAFINTFINVRAP